MQEILLLFGRLLFCSLGMITLCGLLVEICYRFCFFLMGRQAGRAYWVVTSWIGTPVHELGHALMCLLFGHRIEKMRLIPTQNGSAMVQHSYKKSNPYAAFGNLWIGLGPIFSCLGVTIAILFFVYPASMHTFWQAMGTLFTDSPSAETILPPVRAFIRGLFTEQTRPLFIRIIAICVLFSLSLHARVSAKDIWSMLPGLPGFLLLAALTAVISCIIGETASAAVSHWAIQLSLAIAGLFCLLLLFAAAQIVLVVLLSLIRLIVRLINGNKRETASPADPSLLDDYRKKNWNDFKK